MGGLSRMLHAVHAPFTAGGAAAAVAPVLHGGTGVARNSTARSTARLSLVALLAVMSLGVHAAEPIRVRVVPAFALNPADVIVETVIEPDVRNRGVEITVDSANFFTTSTVTLEGDRAPRVRTSRFRQLPAGNYEVSATLVQESGIRSRVAAVLEIQ